MEFFNGFWDDRWVIFWWRRIHPCLQLSFSFQICWKIFDGIFQIGTSCLNLGQPKRINEIRNELKIVFFCSFFLKILNHLFLCCSSLFSSRRSFHWFWRNYFRFQIVSFKIKKIEDVTIRDVTHGERFWKKHIFFLQIVEYLLREYFLTIYCMDYRLWQWSSNRKIILRKPNFKFFPKVCLIFPNNSYFISFVNKNILIYDMDISCTSASQTFLTRGQKV